MVQKQELPYPQEKMTQEAVETEKMKAGQLALDAATTSSSSTRFLFFSIIHALGSCVIHRLSRRSVRGSSPRHL
ncbi:hypothetical protein ACFX13_000171 [Malus domestica]